MTDASNRLLQVPEMPGAVNPTTNQNYLLTQIAAQSAQAKKAAAATGTKTAPPKGYVANPTFDKRIRTINDFTGATGAAFLRGFMVTALPINGYYYVLNFLYNPTTVSASHSLDNALITGQGKNPLDTTTPNVPLAQEVSFSLLFDRTYELWDATYANSEVGQRGVMMDVLALYRMVQITAPPSVDADGTVHSGVVSPSNSPAFFRPRGPMLQTPLRCNIGDPLSYYGYIDTINITYTHWSHAMIPMRCQVDIDFTLLPDPDGSLSFGRVNADQFPSNTFGSFQVVTQKSGFSVGGLAGR
jgi:hypothetical protein